MPLLARNSCLEALALLTWGRQPNRVAGGRRHRSRRSRAPLPRRVPASSLQVSEARLEDVDTSSQKQKGTSLGCWVLAQAVVLLSGRCQPYQCQHMTSTAAQKCTRFWCASRPCVPTSVRVLLPCAGALPCRGGCRNRQDASRRHNKVPGVHHQGKQDEALGAGQLGLQRG